MDIEIVHEREVEFDRKGVRRNSLSELPCGAQKTSLSKGGSGVGGGRCIKTSVFDVFKIGPGPSSSHTIGPMKICNDFLGCVRTELVPTLSARERGARYKLLIHLHGSLSATGLGHGTHNAVIGGLLGWEPKTCDPLALLSLLKERDVQHEFPVAELGPIKIGFDSIVWHDPAKSSHLYHPNTLHLEIVLQGGAGEVIFEREYYSVGGGFIEKKGCLPEDFREVDPVFPFTRYAQVLAHVTREQKDVVELVLENETRLTGLPRDEILAKVGEILDAMDSSVERGLAAEGLLPGAIQLKRKAKAVFESGRRARGANPLNLLNAFAMAASEENAAGMMVVTAPTSGSAGVLPGILYYMKTHLDVDRETRINSLICSCLVGFLVKHNASISGAEMGCMGEIGVASSMGAAMLAYAQPPPAAAEDLYRWHKTIEAAAEIALEHHLGVTCDPIGGYVQIPCIQRNSMGAVKAYNAFLLATASDPSDQKISLDDVIDTMKRTGEDMNKNYKETSQGGLAMLTVAHSEC